MARYTGPRLRKMRALGVDLPGLSRKSLERRPYPPGQHGQRRRGRVSDYGRQLVEKQKLRYNYGVGERQFRRLVKEAKASKMATGEKLLELLERRLDNVVFRAGFAPTIPAARQLTKHGHFMVNGRRVDIPSYRVRVGDTLTIRPRSQELACIKESLAAPALTVPDWLEFDSGQVAARVAALPDSGAVPFDVEVQLVVEYYAKRI
ncbi:MAG: 30S ribosomal protein S4 [Deltaproteobacteria bacterium]|nr:30S ribosomal protein S4 [Deltaproteobacteria bacterium]